ncbi:taurine catabolism dioxygenase TauD [Thiocapsa imhoffii]|uniref:Taurine catabolism dioxygenase TauD n=1 Tax=Thiocapsa imhoffii TaxID=382777 RepID=A0A9X1B8Y9_9GAMM|nr:TauD/TfdA family dioxygenase [Thiocapsa imhoffii]MBK1645409.1 taurine catabolism dioxygenase TauD [Thiocapsa imhoffii]
MSHPFDLTDERAYQAWRARKLAQAPTAVADLIVEVGDPRRLSAAEHAAIQQRCDRANMAIYVGTTGTDPDKAIPLALGAQFGLYQLDHNPGADDDAVTALTVQTDAAHRDFIPYTNRPIAWHTDGYYNARNRQIQGLLLHCVRPAAQGGANALLDHEIAYLLVRDQHPDHIAALMHPHCLCIPAHHRDGVQQRPARSGPVFSVTAAGHLHMRYTDRARNIQWRDDPATTAAVACLKEVLRTPSPWHLEARLEAGWGLISNNVLHTRSGFNDGPKPRLLYRARYSDRIARMDRTPPGARVAELEC